MPGLIVGLTRGAAFAALLAASLCAAAQDTKAVFVYSGGAMTPLAQVTPQGIRNFGPKNGDDDEAKRWFAPWFAAGRSYHFLGNDGARGMGTSAGPFSDALPAHGRTPATIVASYAWDSTDAAYAHKQQPAPGMPFIGFTLTLILEADNAQRYHASHAIFQRADSESSMSYFDFFTAADLDGDGRDEIILKGSGYEWWWYEIFGKRRSRWKSLAAGGGGGV